MKIKKFRLPIYHSRIIFIESNNYDEVVKYFKKVDYDLDLRSGELFASVIDHYLLEKGEKYLCMYLIINPKNNFSILNYGIIAHEAVHLANGIYDSKGATGIDDEPFTYLVEYFVNEICKFLKVKSKLTKIR